MDINQLSYKYTPQIDSSHAFLLLHGVSEGIEPDFIQSIYNSLVNRQETVLAIDFPYITNQQKPSQDLHDETAALAGAITFLQHEHYTHITIIAKSLGGIVTSRWLRQNPLIANVEVIILGYVLGDVDTLALKDRLRLVVQGENDRFGNGAAISKALELEHVKAKVIQIADADHSYRNKLGQQEYQPVVIKKLFDSITD